MKKLLIYAIFTILAAVAFRGQAQATCTQSHVFITGEVLTATILNANPIAEIACINNIDNTNIGANGIFASQIIPTTVGQATFGGSVGYTFSHGLTVSGGLTLSGGFSISGGLTVSTGNITITSGSLLTGSSTYGATSATVNGGLTAMIFSGSQSYSVGDTYRWKCGSGSGVCSITASSGLSIGAVTGSLLCFDNSGVLPIDCFDTSGDAAFGGAIEGSSDGTHISYVPPGYTLSGGALASTWHSAQGTTTIVLNGSCASQAVCVITSGATITFSGAAAFASATSYACMVDQNNGLSAGAAFLPANLSGSSMSIVVQNISSSNISGSIPMTVVCTGT